MSMQNNWLSNDRRRRLGLAHRWGNGPASLWIAEDFGCCASGRWWNEVRVCGLKFGGAWIPGLLRTHCYGERIGAPTPIAHSTTLPYRRNTSPKVRRFEFKWFLPTPFTHQTRYRVLVGRRAHYHPGDGVPAGFLPLGSKGPWVGLTRQAPTSIVPRRSPGKAPPPGHPFNIDVFEGKADLARGG